jgi:hypothetical protein
MDKLEPPLSTLYEATAALERVDPEDLPAVEAILGRRLKALRDIHSLSHHATDLAGCLMPAFESGCNTGSPKIIRRLFYCAPSPPPNFRMNRRLR